MFWLKKLVGALLMPLPLALSAIAAGAIFLFAGAPEWGVWLVLFGILWLTAASNQGLSIRLVHRLEAQHPPMPELADGQVPPDHLAACRFVAILGGGHGDATGGAAVSRLSSSSLARLVEAARLIRHLPQARLICFGPGGPDKESHAAVLRQAAMSLGVASERIQTAPDVLDTRDEVTKLHELAGGAPVALVTSAWHMPRAVGLARHVGLNVIACPADFAHRPDAAGEQRWWTFNVSSLVRSTKAVHEGIGLLWAWLRRTR